LDWLVARCLHRHGSRIVFDLRSGFLGLCGHVVVERFPIKYPRDRILTLDSQKLARRGMEDCAAYLVLDHRVRQRCDQAFHAIDADVS